jgi:preprotein translocase subunit SecE
MNKIIQFLKEVRIELTKVTWPTRKQLIKYTLIVIALSLVLAAFLGALDSLFSYLLNIFVL